jgi:hypothetical protein
MTRAKQLPVASIKPGKEGKQRHEHDHGKKSQRAARKLKNANNFFLHITPFFESSHTDYGRETEVAFLCIFPFPFFSE